MVTVINFRCREGSSVVIIEGKMVTVVIIEGKMVTVVIMEGKMVTVVIIEGKTPSDSVFTSIRSREKVGEDGVGSRSVIRAV